MYKTDNGSYGAIGISIGPIFGLKGVQIASKRIAAWTREHFPDYYSLQVEGVGRAKPMQNSLIVARFCLNMGPLNYVHKVWLLCL